MKTLEAAAAAAGKTVEEYRADHWRRIGGRVAETIARKQATRAGRVSLREGRRVAPKKPIPGVESELAEAFRGMGHSEAGALAAARGRGGRTNAAASLEEAARDLGHTPAAAKAFAVGRGSPEVADLTEAGRLLGHTESRARTFARGRGRLLEAVTDGSGFVAGDYAYVGDETDPATWKLLLVQNPGDGASGAYDQDLVRQAATALAVPEWGAPQVDIPAEDLDRVRQTVRGAWVQSGLPLNQIPPALDEAALRDAFRKIGMSDRAAAVAAEGRGRRSGR